MTEIGTLEDTLFVPMIGRIYATEHFPRILCDRKALELRAGLPPGILAADRQSQYTLIASAVRSANMDRFIRAFLERHENGAVAELGCGLETACCRNDNGRSRWFLVDLPGVIAFRRTLLPDTERVTGIPGDVFDEHWIRRIRSELPDAPLLLVASGLFHYYREEDVLGLLGRLARFGGIEIVFDAVSRTGLEMMRRKHMKDVGHADAEVHFYVDSARSLERRTGGAVEVLAEEDFYRNTVRSGLQLSTRLSMTISDLFHMVKTVHLQTVPGLPQEPRREEAAA